MGQDWLPFVHPAFTRWRTGEFGPRGKAGQFWREHVRHDPEFRDVVVCLELVFGGDKVVRLSSERIVSYAENGDAIHWRGGINADPEFDQTIGFMQGVSAARTLSLSVPQAAVDPAELMSRGRMVAGFGEVSLQVDGMAYEERLVLMRGDMDDGVSFATGGSGVVTFSIADAKDHANLNLSAWVLTAEAVEHLTVAGGVTDSDIGQRYPLVFNRAIVPCLRLEGDPVTTNLVMVCYGHHHTVNTVYVDGEAYGAGDADFAWNKQELFDAYGVPITCIQFTGAYNWDESEMVHVDVTAGWPSAQGLFDVIKTICAGYTTLGTHGLDMEAFGRAKAAMPMDTVEVLINGSGEGTEAKAIDYIETELVAGFPMVSMMFGPQGYGPVVTDRRHGPIVADLTAGQFPLIGRASSEVQELGKSSCYNNFTVRYDYNVITGAWAGCVTRTPSNNELCRMSRTTAGVGDRTMDPIESVQIKDRATAEWVADWLVAHLALPSHYVEYPAFPWALVHLRHGMRLRLTDDDQGWLQAIATVERIAYRRGAHCTVGLRVWALFDFYRTGGAGSASAGA